MRRAGGAALGVATLIAVLQQHHDATREEKPDASEEQE